MDPNRNRNLNRNSQTQLPPSTEPRTRGGTCATCLVEFRQSVVKVVAVLATIASKIFCLVWRTGRTQSKNSGKLVLQRSSVWRCLESWYEECPESSAPKQRLHSCSKGVRKEHIATANFPMFQMPLLSIIFCLSSFRSLGHS